MNDYAKERTLEFLESWLAFHARNDDMPGFVVGISLKGKTIFEKAYGLANVETGEPLTTGHIFNIASQSKMFTATAILQLAQEQLLNLDDFLATHLPWLAKHRDKRMQAVTIRQLLWHGAGLIRDGLEADFWQLRAPFPDAAAIKRMTLAADLVLESGTKVKYSDLGYAILGQIIEAVTLNSYDSEMHRRIILPLGMHGASVDYDPSREPRIPTSYTRPMQGKRLAAPKAIKTRGFASAVGWYAAPGDMLRFMAAQLPGKTVLLRKAAKAQLHYGERHHWVPPAYRGSTFGLGFYHLGYNGRTLLGHSGSSVASRSCSFFDPVSQLAVVVMANAKDAPINDMLLGVFNVFDFFEQYAKKTTPPAWQQMNVRLANLLSTRQVVATNERIVLIYPEDWLPFEGAEGLEFVDDTTLRIIETSDLMAEGELVRFTFRGQDVHSANYAGTTLLPESKYYQWLANYWPSS